MRYAKFWNVGSQSNPSVQHRVSLCDDGSYACSCVQWTRRMPRQNCRHIWEVIAGHGEEIDPLIRAIELANRHHERQMARKETMYE